MRKPINLTDKKTPNKMKRNLRSRHNQPVINNQLIIELSDSDDNDYKASKKSEDEDYIVKQDKKKEKIVADKRESTKKRAKRNAQSKDVKSVKRKNQKESLETFNNKRLKLEGSSCTDSTDVKVPQQNQKDLIKTHIKEDVKIEEKSNSNFLRSTGPMQWTDVDYVSEISNVDKRIVENVTFYRKI